jgi:hypothetical protein
MEANEHLHKKGLINKAKDVQRDLIENVERSTHTHMSRYS